MSIRSFCLHDIPFHNQETDYTCGVAVARMLLQGLWKIEMTESDLGQVLGVTKEAGISRRDFFKLSELVNPAESLELVTGTNSSLEALSQMLATNYAIAVNYFLREGAKSEGHWAVLHGFDNQHVFLLDPWVGRDHKIPIKDFNSSWHCGAGINERGTPDEHRGYVAFRKSA